MINSLALAKDANSIVYSAARAWFGAITLGAVSWYTKCDSLWFGYLRFLQATAITGFGDTLTHNDRGLI